MLSWGGCWLLLIQLMLAACLLRAKESCIFDAIRPREFVLANVSYPEVSRLLYDDDLQSRKRREVSFDDLFAPIRVSVFFHQIELKASYKESLKAVVNKAVSLIQNIFSVIPVNGPLVLVRSGCRSVWDTETNAGKCSAVKKGYRGEICANEFQMPNDHLEELVLWNSTGLLPKTVLFSRGNGVDNTDFILYVQSISSSQCFSGELNIIAYATYCKLDQKGRPIAGYINICPQMIRENGFYSDKLSVTVLHELFHALGFSSDLFSNFKNCFLTGNQSVSCNPLSRTVRTVHGAQRLVTRRVSDIASKHFGCLHSNFGPILQTEDGEVKSHWDAAFMQGSLMMPTISQPQLTLLDNITLAVFEDSGWYKVNYGFAQDFYWGKDEGCEFGLNSSCHAMKSDYFCQQSSVGCHYLFRDKGMCDTNPFLHECRIYDPRPEDSCQTYLNDSASLFGQFYGPTGRCFLSNLTQEQGSHFLLTSYPEGRCYEHWCNATGHLFVRIQSVWLFCPAGSFIKVPGLDGIIQCPQAEVICRELQPLFPASPATTKTFSTASIAATSPNNEGKELKAELEFDSLPVFDRENVKLTGQLLDAVRKEIVLVTDASNEKICNMIAVWTRNVVQFVLATVATHSLNDSMNFMACLSRAVNAGNFSISLFGSVQRAKTIRWLLENSSLSLPETSSAVSPMLHPTLSGSGFISVIAVGCVIAIVIVFAVVFLAFRYCCLKRRYKTKPDHSMSASSSVV